LFKDTKFLISKILKHILILKYAPIRHLQSGSDSRKQPTASNPKIFDVIRNEDIKQERKLASASRSLYTLAAVIITFKKTKNYIPNSIR